MAHGAPANGSGAATLVLGRARSDGVQNTWRHALRGLSHYKETEEQEGQALVSLREARERLEAAGYKESCPGRVKPPAPPGPSPNFRGSSSSSGQWVPPPPSTACPMVPRPVPNTDWVQNADISAQDLRDDIDSVEKRKRRSK